MSSGRVELIACETCGSKQCDAEGRTRGQQLIALLQTHARDTSPQVVLSSTRCLWACSRHCAVHVRGEGRVGYILSTLEPSAVFARALLDYAAQYAESSDGAVPFKLWPNALRGHFLCRVPPAPPTELTNAQNEAGE